MSAGLDLSRVVRSWLREDEHERADHVLEIVLARLDATPQRRSWWPARRNFAMSNLTRIAAGLAAVLAIAVGAVALSPLLNSANPPATPGTSPSPTPDGSGAVVVLEPGGHETKQFRPTIAYTVPAGWTVVQDNPTSFKLAPAAFTNAELTVCRNPQPGDKEAKPVTGIGSDARSLATWFADRPEVGVISGPTDWAQGGLVGYWFDLQGPTGSVDINLIGVADGNGCGIDILPEQRVRLGFLDAPDATLLVYIWDVFGGDGYIESATDVLETFAFDVR